MDNEKNKNKLIISVCLVVFILMSIYLIPLSRTIADYNFFTGDKLKFVGFISSIKSLFFYKKQLTLYLIFEICLFLFIATMIYLKFTKTQTFKSDVVEITPNIHIPAPAGQGQFGSRWFMQEKEKKKAFKTNVINLENSLIKSLIKDGASDIIDKIKDIKNGKPIDKVVEEIKEHKQNKNNKYEEEKHKEEWRENYEKDLKDNNFYIDNNIPDNYCIENVEEDITVEGNYDEFTESLVKEIAEKEAKNLEMEKPYNPKNDKLKMFDSGGLIIGYDVDKKANKETIYYIDEDTHGVILGMTRSGKSRCVVLPSLGNLGLAGESIVVTDPKGELYSYTYKFFESLGYEVICLDFKNSKASSKYNLLQPIINAKKEGDIESVVKYSEELSNMLIKEAKGENPMWTDNAKSMLTGAILTLILENKEEKYQNMSNVYRLLNDGEGKDISKNMDNLGLYIRALQLAKPESPVINAMLGIINTPSETRGGFSTNASSATRLFTQPSIWEITHKSNVDLTEIGKKKKILYFILPDQDTSYYRIVSIIVKQMYNELVKLSEKCGNRLPVRVNFILDEFGNFAKIPDLDTLLTVSGSRGMRFNLFLQGFPQIVQKYDKETAEIVKSNCETWIYLKSNDTATPEEISKKLGSYTIYSNSESRNIQNGSSSSSSTSQSLQKRNLLLPEEIMEISRPYLLVMNGNNKPAINKCPDISEESFNYMFGLGDKTHNNYLIQLRNEQREINAEKEEIEYYSLYQNILNYCNSVIDVNTDLNTGEKLSSPRRIKDDEYIATIVNYIKENCEDEI